MATSRLKFNYYITLRFSVVAKPNFTLMIITSYTFVSKGILKEQTFKIKADWIKGQTVYTCFFDYTKNMIPFIVDQEMPLEVLTMKEKSLMISLVEKGIDFKVNIWQEEDIVEGKEVDFDFHF